MTNDLNGFLYLKFYDMYKNNFFEVYAESEKALDLFLIQHNFDMTIKNHIEFISNEQLESLSHVDCPYYLLGIHKFYSNYLDKEFNIMTNKYFINESLTAACNELSRNIICDQMILRDDIGFINHLNELINSLSFGMVTSLSAIDDVEDDRFDRFGDRHYTRKSGTDTLLFDMAYEVQNNLADNEYVVCTLESYVETFSKLLAGGIYK